MCYWCMERQIYFSFCHAHQTSVPLFWLIRQFGGQQLLAMRYINDSILIQFGAPQGASCEAHSEQAVKVPLQTLQGSGDSAKHDKFP
jgi:hypothetical protein